MTSHATLPRFTSRWDEAEFCERYPILPRVLLWTLPAVMFVVAAGAGYALYPEMIRGEIRQLPARERAVFDAIASDAVRIGERDEYLRSFVPYMTVAVSVNWSWRAGEYRVTEVTFIDGGGTVKNGALNAATFDELAKLPSLARICVPFATPLEANGLEKYVKQRGMKCEVSRN